MADDNPEQMTPEEAREVWTFLDHPVFKQVEKVNEFLDSFFNGIKDTLLEDVPGWLSDTFTGSKTTTEEIEAGTTKHVRDRLSAEGVPTEVIDEVISGFKGAGTFGWIGEKALMIVMAFTTFVKCMSQIYGAVGKYKVKRLNKILRPEPGDLASLLTWKFRTAANGKYGELLGEIGLQQNWEDVVLKAAESYADVGDVQEARRRGILGDRQYVAHLKALGFQDGGQRAILQEIVNPLLSVPELFELRRRGEIGPGLYDQLFRRHGHTTQDRIALQKLAWQVLPIGVTIDQYYRKGLQDAPYLKNMLQLGYEPATAKPILESSEALLTTWEITRAMFRELMTPGEAADYLRKIRYSGLDADRLLKIAKVLPTPTDLVRFGVREVYTPEIAKLFGQYENYPVGMTPWGKKIGLDEDILKMYWAAHWSLPPATQGFSMYHRGIIDAPQLRLLLRALDIMPFWRDRVIQLSYNLIPRRMIIRLLLAGEITPEDAFKRYRALGYAPADAEVMIRLDKEDEGPVVKTMTRADVQNGYRRGHIDRAEAGKMLADLRYDETSVNYYLVETDRRIADDKATETGDTDRETVERARELTRTDVLNGFRDGLITEDDTRSMLGVLGYSAEAVDYLVLKEQLSQVLGDLRLKGKQVKRRFDAGLLDVNQARAELIRHGYVTGEAERAVHLWDIERNADRQLDTIRDRLPTRSVLNTWVKEGVITPESWVDYMRALKYGDGEIQHFLEALLIGLGD